MPIMVSAKQTNKNPTMMRPAGGFNIECDPQILIPASVRQDRNKPVLPTSTPSCRNIPHDAVDKLIIVNKT
ncbi:unnamed protein product, partial [Didymodactylos carnosus]